MVKVLLDRWEWRYVRRMAEARTRIAEKAGYRKKDDNGLTYSQIDFLGVAGETAFYKLLDRFPVMSQDAKQAGKPDIVVHGQTVDIKTIEERHKNLITRKKKTKFDMYVLMLMEKPHVYYIGYIRGKNLLIPKRLITLYDQPVYKAFQKELFTGKFWELESREFPIISKSGKLRKAAEVGEVVTNPSSKYYEAQKNYPGQKTRVERI